MPSSGSQVKKRAQKKTVVVEISDEASESDPDVPVAASRSPAKSTTATKRKTRKSAVSAQDDDSPFVEINSIFCAGF
ncbi:hypothetical protein APHAL10511_007770 [Amanita phalloides]|nr:hypothetical protein APHAL10511_007770 [Amanita phalloides]